MLCLEPADDLKARYPTAFEIDPSWLIACAARRQKWLDMGQSLNLYVAEPSGRLLSDTYQQAWRAGMKTTYYLRSRGATQRAPPSCSGRYAGSAPSSPCLTQYQKAVFARRRQGKPLRACRVTIKVMTKTRRSRRSPDKPDGSETPAPRLE